MSKFGNFSAGITAVAAATIVNTAFATHCYAQDQRSLIGELSACRSISESSARLSCLDKAAEALVQAHDAGDLTVVDRQQVNEARRNLFGFSNVALLSFLGSSNDREEISSIQTSLVRAASDSTGRWVFHLTDGSEWRQVDNESAHIRLQNGSEVRVRRAAFGSYFLNVGDARAIRVKRQ